MVRIIAWEVTRRCPLACRHCRAGAQDCTYADELSTDECLRVIDSIAAEGSPMIIFTGGEPMYREDLPALVRHASKKGLRSVLAPCGKLVTEESLLALKEAGIKACSFSVDGPTKELHDSFRGIDGAFEQITGAMAIARKIGMPFQMNAAVSRLNVHALPQMRDLAFDLGASMVDFFFLVPVGRGKGLADQALSPDEAEAALKWIGAERRGKIPLRVTCAPQSVRIWNGEGTGCMGGKGFVFISHTGVLQPCGFLDIACGNLRDFDFNFPAAYKASSVFADLQNPDKLKGGCGNCGFKTLCGGCRARAFSATGDYLEAETTCRLCQH